MKLNKQKLLTEKYCFEIFKGSEKLINLNQAMEVVMDYRQKKYLRQQRNARLRVKAQLYKNFNTKASSTRLKLQEDDELYGGVKPSTEDLTEREMIGKDDT